MYTATVNHIKSLRSQVYIHTHSSQYRDADRTKMKKNRDSSECRMQRKLFRPSFWKRAQ